MEDDALQDAIDKITARLVKNTQRLDKAVSKPHKDLLQLTISEDTRKLRELTERPVS